MKNVITISRQKGSGGREIAEMVARQLGWPLLYKEMVTDAAEKAGVDYAKIEAAFDNKPSLKARVTMRERMSKYLDVLSAVIHEYAEEGNVVLLGRGANTILGADPRLFRVHLVAELDTRIERVALKCKAKGEKGLQEARKMVIDSDYARSAYHTYLFNVDWNDPLGYDLVLNTTGITMRRAADAVLAVFDTVG